MGRDLTSDDHTSFLMGLDAIIMVHVSICKTVIGNQTLCTYAKRTIYATRIFTSLGTIHSANQKIKWRIYPSAITLILREFQAISGGIW